MCGIAGWIDWEEDLTGHRSTIEGMADTLCHRGPDAQGEWLSDRVAFAHRRLIVIDPQGGKQPMVYQENDRICDYRLVEYVWNIPWEMKTVGNIEKGILRRALTGILPDDVRTRHKRVLPQAR